ncbi:MAG: hypothetical protein ACRD2K_06365 [Terriglobales bacterium]
MRSLRPPARAGWARSTAPATPASTADSNPAPLNLVVNWAAALKK